MKCYFCHKDVEQDPDNSPGPFKSLRSKSCFNCTSHNGIHHVSFIYEEDGSYKYAHIYLDEVKYMGFGGGRFPFTPTYIPQNSTYHIRLNMKAGTTSVMVYGTTEEILCLPTLNITPANVREKIKLYLLFS